MSAYRAKHEPLDPWKHIKAPTIMATKVSAFVALYDIALRSQCKTFAHALGRIGYIMIPFPALTMAFQGVAYTAASLRSKHDLWNYHFAGLFLLPVIRKWSALPITSMAGLYFLAADKITLFSAIKFADGMPRVHEPILKPARVPCHYD